MVMWAIIICLWSIESAPKSQCVINYLEFESNIAHLDLPSCPEGIEMDPQKDFVVWV